MGVISRTSFLSFAIVYSSFIRFALLPVRRQEVQISISAFGRFCKCAAFFLRL